MEYDGNKYKEYLKAFDKLQSAKVRMYAAMTRIASDSSDKKSFVIYDMAESDLIRAKENVRLTKLSYLESVLLLEYGLKLA